MKKPLLILIAFAVTVTLNQCTVQYSMGGATIASDVKTISFEDFSNRAPSGPSDLGQFFTNELKDKFQSQTNLKFVDDDGDLIFSGEITDYSTQPTAVTGNERASMTRLSITVHVNFVNQKHPDNSFETNFTHYEDFESSKSLTQVEDQLVEEISTKLIDDIFNKSVVNW
jgi:hypothetical protein